MKRTIITLAAAAFTFPAFAQQAQPSQEEVNALLQTVANQREAANNQVAQLAAKLQVTTAELEKVKKEAAACKPAPAKEDKK